MKKAIYLYCLCLCLVNSSTLAQTKEPTSNSDIQLSLLKDQYKMLQEKDEKIIARYENIITELKEERKNHQDFVESTYKWMSIIVGAVVLLFGGILSFFGWNKFKQIKQEADILVTEKCTNLIADVVSGKKDIISTQLEKYDLQAKLRKKNNIVILSESLEKGQDLEAYLTKVGFKVDKAIISAFYEINGILISELTKWDVVIFNDLESGWNEKDIQKKLIESNSTKSILFYLGGHIDPDNKKFSVSAVNMPSQLYGNLMNLLEYKHAVEV